MKWDDDPLSIVIILLVLSLIAALIWLNLHVKDGGQECPACHGKGWVEVSE